MEARHKAILDDIPEAYSHEVQATNGPGTSALERGAWVTQRYGRLRTLAINIGNLQAAQQDVRALAQEVSVIKRELLNQQDAMVQLQYIRNLKDQWKLTVPIAQANLHKAQADFNKCQMKVTVYSQLEKELEGHSSRPTSTAQRAQEQQRTNFNR